MNGDGANMKKDSPKKWYDQDLDDEGKAKYDILGEEKKNSTAPEKKTDYEKIHKDILTSYADYHRI